jgi:hypothetical protein
LETVSNTKPPGPPDSDLSHEPWSAVIPTPSHIVSTPKHLVSFATVGYERGMPLSIERKESALHVQITAPRVEQWDALMNGPPQPKPLAIHLPSRIDGGKEADGVRLLVGLGGPRVLRHSPTAPLRETKPNLGPIDGAHGFDAHGRMRYSPGMPGRCMVTRTADGSHAPDC